MYARIINGRVAELTEAPPVLHPGECALIVEVFDWDVRVGWLWTPEGFAPMPEPTLEQAKAAKLAEIIAGADALLNDLASGYSAGEKLSWPKQEAEALALAADAEAPAPLLRGIAAVRGITVTALRDKVLASVAQYELVTAVVLGTQQRYEDMLKAAATVDEARAIAVNYSVPGAG